jgi:hypothetical protein
MVADLHERVPIHGETAAGFRDRPAVRGEPVPLRRERGRFMVKRLRFTTKQLRFAVKRSRFAMNAGRFTVNGPASP